MGFRLYISNEPPNKNDSFLTFSRNNNLILDGGAWELNIFNLTDFNNETINRTKEKCNTYPNCFMCDCSDDTWTKITLENLKDQEKVLHDNPNIAYGFLVEEIPDKDYETKSFCSYQYIINHQHRKYIWINIC